MSKPALVQRSTFISSATALRFNCIFMARNTAVTSRTIDYNEPQKINVLWLSNMNLQDRHMNKVGLLSVERIFKLIHLSG